MTESEKIRKVLELKAVKVSKAEQLSGFGVGTISKMLERDGGMNEENVKKFQRTFNINLEWWKTGKGEVFNPPETVINESAVDYDSTTRLIKIFDRLVESKEAEINRLERTQEQLENDKLQLLKDKTWMEAKIDQLMTRLSAPN